jgi:hypothetical protein
MVASILISLIFVSLGLSASTAYGLETQMNSGVYEVPTQDPALKPFATLKLKEASIAFLDEEKNTAIVHYVLPLELTGHPTVVELDGRKTPGSKIITFEGPEAESTCAGTWANLQCNIAFRVDRLNIDSRRVDQFLRGKYGIDEDFPSAFDKSADMDLAIGSATGNFTQAQNSYLAASEVAKQFANEAIGFIKAVKTEGENLAAAIDLFPGDRLDFKKSKVGERWIRVHGFGSSTLTIEHPLGPVPMSMHGPYGRLIDEVESMQNAKSQIVFDDSLKFTIYLRIDDSNEPEGTIYSISF